MAMVIKAGDRKTADRIRRRLWRKLEASRFDVGGPNGLTVRYKGRRGRERCEVVVGDNGGFGYFGGIRLREAKDNCGNHPGPCVLTGKKHKVNKYLEGRDWVAFNDTVNDVLDACRFDGWAGTSVVTIRQGPSRRVHYGATYTRYPHTDWDKDGTAADYEDCRGRKAPRSRCPADTPGLVGWRRKRKKQEATTCPKPVSTSGPSTSP